VETGRVVLGADLATAGGVAARQAEVVDVQRRAMLATVYSTFRVMLQKTHPTRGRAPIVRCPMTAPPANAPVAHLPPMLEACEHNTLARHRDCDDPKKAA
jgi:hypothetical protein